MISWIAINDKKEKQHIFGKIKKGIKEVIIGLGSNSKVTHAIIELRCRVLDTEKKETKKIKSHR